MKGNWMVREDLVRLKQNYYNSIDFSIDYIDNKYEYERALFYNGKYASIVGYCHDLIQEYDNILRELKNRSIQATLEYSKGYFRVCVDGCYRYKRVNSIYKGLRYEYSQLMGIGA